MDSLYAAILGALQGMTEFLPISSSGHLVIAQYFIPNFSQPGVLFDVILHLGTLISVFLVFWRKIFSFDYKFYKLIIIGTIPAVIIGLLFQDQLENLFTNMTGVAIAFIVTGVMNLLVDKFKNVGNQITNKDSTVIGLAQAFAIIPSISRSGATIFAASARGIDKRVAAEFSFILSIPAILGAIGLQVATHFNPVEFQAAPYLVGFLSALLFGVLSIKLALKFLLSKNFKIFGIYCIVLGIMVFFI
jgi:undecaprenyl-diphosphatase